MFDKDLFYSLCEKYHVELSDKYTSAMIKDGENLIELDDDEIKKVFSAFKSSVTYKESDNKTIVVQQSIFKLDEYPTAC